MSNLEINAKAKGKFRVQKRNVDTGEIYYDSGDFNNNLLNNFFASGTNNFSNAFVGTDSAVNNSDTTMSVIGATAQRTSYTPSYSVDATGKVTQLLVQVYTFAAGAIVGNMSCIGLSLASNVSGTNLRIKSLIKDVNGDPTTIPATATDQIIVTHTFELTYNQQQALGTFNIDGINYTATFYGIYATTIDSILDARFGLLAQGSFGSSFTAHIGSGFTPPTIPTVSAGTMTLVNRLSVSAQTNFTNTYSGSNYLATACTFTVAATSNLPSNAPIAAVGIATGTGSTAMYAVVAFSPALPKNSSIAYTMTIKFTLSRA